MFQWLQSFLRPLWNAVGQVPSSVTDNYDAVLSSSLRAYQSKLRDNIVKGNKVLSWLDSKGRFRKQNGGYNVAVPLMHQLNSSADIYSGYGTLDTTPQDGITTAFYDWSQISVSIAISGLEKKRNKGQYKIFDLLRAKTDQAESTARELLNDCIVVGRITSSSDEGRFLAKTGRLDSGSSGPLPLAALIDAVPSRSVSIGNINGGTYSFWRNQSTESAATTFVTLRNEIQRVYNNCSKGTGGSPDLLLGDQVAWETYWLGISSLERYIIEDKKVLDTLGGADALKFRGAAFIWDEQVPDVETNAVPATVGAAAVGTITLSNIWFINSPGMEFITESDTDFATTPFMRPENHDATVAQILWMGALGVNNRRKQGVLYGISQSITA